MVYNMATITINVNSQINQPPNQIGNIDIIVPYGVNYVFTRNDFTNFAIPRYEDPEGDGASKLKIIIKWQDIDNTSLKYNNVDVFENQEILFTDIDAGLLIFFPDLTITTGANYEGAAFTISDLGSNQYHEGVAKIYITVNPQI